MRELHHTLVSVCGEREGRFRENNCTAFAGPLALKSIFRRCASHAVEKLIEGLVVIGMVHKGCALPSEALLETECGGRSSR
jgi:hypothetical protein